MSSIDKLVALLKIQKSGEGIAREIAELLLDDVGTEIFICKLTEAHVTLELRKQKLSGMEQEALDIINGANAPLSAVDVSKRADGRSLRHIAHASATLHLLFVKGRIDRIKRGYTFFYFKWEPT